MNSKNIECESFSNLVNQVKQNGTESCNFPGLQRDRDGIIHRETANIASELKSLVDDQIVDGSTVRVVGYDCPNLAADYKDNWRGLLCGWISRGATVHYLVQKSERETEEKVKSLFEHCLNCDGLDGDILSQRLRVFLRNNEKKASPEDQDVLDKWKTFHFAVIDSPDLLWIEHKHPATSTRAQDCEFHTSHAVKRNPKFRRIFKDNFDRMASKYFKEYLPVYSAKPNK